MQTLLIIVHLIVVIALVGVVLLQRSEGGALGVGGNNNFLTGRGQGNALTRATSILAALFFATSILLSMHASWYRDTPLINKSSLPPALDSNKIDPSKGNIYDQLKKLEEPSPSKQ